MRASDRLPLITILVVVGTLFVVDRLSSPRGLLPKVQEQAIMHRVESARDTALERQLEEERARSRQRELAASAAQRRSDSSASVAHLKSDSMAAVARAAQTAQDSAAAWQSAFEAKAREAAALEASRDSARAETREVKVQLAAADSQTGTWQRHAARGDSLVAVLTPLAQRAGDDCRILWIVHCPSRKVIAIGAAVATAGAIYIGRKAVKGELKIRLPIG